MVALAYFLMSTAIALPSAEEILTAVDQNMAYETRNAHIEMTVVKGRRTKVYKGALCSTAPEIIRKLS